MAKRRNTLWFSLLIAGAASVALLRMASLAAAAPTKALILITTSQDGETSPCG